MFNFFRKTVATILAILMGIVLPLQSYALTLNIEQVKKVTEISGKLSIYMEKIKAKQLTILEKDEVGTFLQDSLAFVRSLNGEAVISSELNAEKSGTSNNSRGVSVSGYNGQVWQINQKECKTSNMVWVPNKDLITLHLQDGDTKYFDLTTGKEIDKKEVDLSVPNLTSPLTICDVNKELYSVDDCKTTFGLDEVVEKLEPFQTQRRDEMTIAYGNPVTAEVKVCPTLDRKLNLVRFGNEIRYYTQEETKQMDVVSVLNKYGQRQVASTESDEDWNKEVVVVGGMSENGVGGDGTTIAIIVAGAVVAGAAILAMGIAYIAAQKAAALALEAMSPSFGGWVVYAVPCTCAYGVWWVIVMGYLEGVPMVMSFSLVTQATLFFPDYFTWMMPTAPVIGRFLYIPQMCWMIAVPCFPVPTIGDIYMIASGIL